MLHQLASLLACLCVSLIGAVPLAVFWRYGREPSVETAIAAVCAAMVFILAISLATGFCIVGRTGWVTGLLGAAVPISAGLNDIRHFLSVKRSMRKSMLTK
jgi:hypothetical protein